MAMTRQGFQKGVAVLAATYQVEPTPEQVKAYWMVLAPIVPDDATWERAVYRVLATLRWFPKPAELLEAAGLTPDDSATATARLEGEGAAWCERILRSSAFYLPSGPAWLPDAVLAIYGPACAQAFSDVGGHATFRAAYNREQDVPFLVRSYGKAYARAVRSGHARPEPNAGRALLTGQAHGALTASGASVRLTTRGGDPARAVRSGETPAPQLHDGGHHDE